MTRAGMTIRAASPAPSQLADSGSAWGAALGITPGAASWNLPAVPIHSVTSSSVRGPALAARAEGVVTSPADSTGAAGEPDRDVAARVSPRNRCVNSLSPPLSAMQVNPPTGRMPDDAYRTV